MSIIMSSEESRKDYSEKKGAVLKLLDEAIQFYQNENENDKIQAFTALRNDLQNGEFKIVVVGEFSSGKSTLLNALMHKRMLPSETKETTATVNFLRHQEKSSSPKVKGKVFYNDGHSIDIENNDLKTISQYVSTNGEDVASKISHVDLFLDSEFLKDNVTLVDSPGLNGVAEGHKEITEQQILESHASIFVFSSDHPGSKTDFEFIRNLQQRVKTIIFVLNKIDNIKSEENNTVESVIENLKSNYRTQFPVAQIPEIHPVSAYDALMARDKDYRESSREEKFRNLSEEKLNKLEERSRLGKFEDRLLTFLTQGEKTKNILLAPIEKILSVAKESKKHFQDNIDVLSEKRDSSELENQINALEDSQKEAESQSMQIKNSISQKVDTALKEIQEELTAKIDGLKNRKLSEIDTYDDIGELNDYIQNFEDKFLSQVRSYMNRSDDDFREKVKYIIQLEYASQTDILNDKIANVESGKKLELTNHLPTDEYAVEVGLDKMNEKVAVLEQELLELQNKAEKAEEDFYVAKQTEIKRNHIENEIKEIKENITSINNTMLPPIREWSEQKSEIDNSFKRRGVMGWIWGLKWGYKPETKVIHKTDDTEHREAKERRDKQIGELENELANLNDIRASLHGEDSSILQLKTASAKAKVEEKRNKLIETMNDNRKAIDDKYSKIIKKCKRALSYFCDDMQEELSRLVKKALQTSRNSYVSSIVQIVEANIHAEIENKQNRIKSLKEQMNSSEQDKNEKIESFKTKIEKIDEILSAGSDLQAEFENIKVDVIQQESV